MNKDSQYVVKREAIGKHGRQSKALKLRKSFELKKGYVRYVDIAYGPDWRVFLYGVANEKTGEITFFYRLILIPDDLTEQYNEILDDDMFGFIEGFGKCSEPHVVRTWCKPSIEFSVDPEEAQMLINYKKSVEKLDESIEAWIDHKMLDVEPSNQQLQDNVPRDLGYWQSLDDAIRRYREDGTIILAPNPFAATDFLVTVGTY